MGDCVRFGVWCDFSGLVCAQGEARGESFKKMGIKARVVENKPQGAKDGSMGGGKLRKYEKQKQVDNNKVRRSKKEKGKKREEREE